MVPNRLKLLFFLNKQIGEEGHFNALSFDLIAKKERIFTAAKLKGQSDQASSILYHIETEECDPHYDRTCPGLS